MKEVVSFGNGERRREIELVVNGRVFTESVSTRKTLADFLREDLGLTGTHLGCEHGVCGACTVRLDGETVRSCLMLAVQCDGHEVQTIEGVASHGGKMSPVQEAFWNRHGLQCGFCTPGMVLAAGELLERLPDPSEEEVREGMGGNLCRCTGYQFIVDAVLEAGRVMRGADPEPGDAAGAGR